MSLELSSIVDRENIIEEAKRLFVTVRDIPYVLGSDGNPQKLFLENKGNCTRKHLYLAEKLLNLGYKIELGVATFDWRDLPIPGDIISKLKDPIDTHLFLFATFGWEESIVDATWDKLMPAGFVKNSWDGISSTPIAVPAQGVRKENVNNFYFKLFAGNSMRFIRGKAGFKKPTPFNDAFNSWLGRK